MDGGVALGSRLSRGDIAAPLRAASTFGGIRLVAAEALALSGMTLPRRCERRLRLAAVHDILWLTQPE